MFVNKSNKTKKVYRLTGLLVYRFTSVCLELILFVYTVHKLYYWWWFTGLQVYICMPRICLICQTINLITDNGLQVYRFTSVLLESVFLLRVYDLFESKIQVCGFTGLLVYSTFLILQVYTFNIIEFAINHNSL